MRPPPAAGPISRQLMFAQAGPGVGVGEGLGLGVGTAGGRVDGDGDGAGTAASATACGAKNNATAHIVAANKRCIQSLLTRKRVPCTGTNSCVPSFALARVGGGVTRDVDVLGVPLPPGNQAAHHQEEHDEDDPQGPAAHRQEPGWEGRIRATMLRRGIGPFLIGAALVSCMLATGTAASAAPKVLPATPKVVNIYASVLRRINPRMPEWLSRDLARHLLANAAHWHIDATMLAAVVTVESRWHTHAVSVAGALGLGQLMPDTAATLDVNPLNPNQNLAGAARYLSGLVQRFAHKANRYALTFAAYNAGPEAVVEYGGIPPFYETQTYVARVLDTWHALQRTIRIPASALLASAAPTWTMAHGADVDYWLKTR